jgi:F0F1-type ATP synthase delta subunit
MKYPAHIYAKALVEVLGDPAVKDAVAAKNFLDLVKRNGDEADLGKMLEEASRFARGKSGVHKITVASARALTESQRYTVNGFIKPGDVVEHRIEPELVAGVKIIVDDELQFDGSLKNKLDRALGSA